MTSYTRSDIERIAELLKEGLAASGIAKRFGDERGIVFTRNAIIGIVRRNQTLRKIGFANATGPRSERRPRKQSLPKIPKAARAPKPSAPPRAKGRVAARYPAPYQLPGRLFISAIEEIDRDGEAFRLKSPSTGRPAIASQPHFAAIRFLDCLPNRCRAPLSSDLEEKTGPDMLCCGFHVEFCKPYCAYHEARLTNREQNFLAEAA
ncbi:GcrA family cell cycle regulator [Mesorhizobium sp. B2-3-4]|uniref:GcrA family cell cycle regulator n=1 Tax=Mesorhizobium sp. B2-3-4 TaxID=2589959 RepID=UPI0011280257|nr:GcrA family cell cycle regulator [Mesorhizobium sp. B2-3-4]TPM39602.1 GcrA cell cycle regulator [Mesorhizobium sp. B2-3-4]